MTDLLAGTAAEALFPDLQGDPDAIADLRARAAALVRPGVALGLAALLTLAVERSPRPMRCERCHRRRVLFAAALELRPDAAYRVSTGPGVILIASPRVCADCAGIRVREEDAGG